MSSSFFYGRIKKLLIRYEHVGIKVEITWKNKMYSNIFLNKSPVYTLFTEMEIMRFIDNL